MSTDPNTLPILPHDLEREIFEIATLLHPHTGPTLTQVARRVQMWIEPLLYESVTKYATGQKAEPPPGSLTRCGTYVRRLLLCDNAEIDATEEYLSQCPNITDLALWNVGIEPTLLPLIAKLPLTRLSIDLEMLFGDSTQFCKYATLSGDPALAHSSPAALILSRLTHLDIANICEDWDSWSGLAHLPNLTHLCLHEQTADETIRKFIYGCTRLSLVAIVGLTPDADAPSGDNAGDWDGEFYTVPDGCSDHRLVRCRVSSFSLDWLNGGVLSRRFDAWQFAEETILMESSTFAV